MCTLPLHFIQMGAAAGILQNDSSIPEDIREKCEINRDVKRQIAQKDAKYLRKELAEPWKNHKAIIKLVTERTKHQLGPFFALPLELFVHSLVRYGGLYIFEI